MRHNIVADNHGPGLKGSCQHPFGEVAPQFHQIHQRRPGEVQYYHPVFVSHECKSLMQCKKEQKSTSFCALRINRLSVKLSMAEEQLMFLSAQAIWRAVFLPCDRDREEGRKG